MGKARTNQEWIQELGSGGELQAAAIQDLYEILNRAAVYTFQRNLGDLANHSQEEINQLAEDCAQEVTIAILKNLAQFRGESKFTTWAYKFAINISLTMARRERWKGVSLDVLDDQPDSIGSPPANFQKSNPETNMEQGEVWQIIRRVIENELTERQRAVLQWMVFEEVPMDVVVEHLDSNRNAVYKLLHDARRKLKAALQEGGLSTSETFDLFQATR